MGTVADTKKLVATRQPKAMSPAVAEVRTNINLMVEVMKSCMVSNMHYGVIQKGMKPSLFKAGAEKLMSVFRLSADPEVTDLSADGEIRFRVRVVIKAQDGSFVGAGIGECSSGEEKYSWRVALCQEEFESFPENMRRLKFKKDFDSGKVIKIPQVRTVPADLANTILKMAKKRGLVDGVLTATGASDLFSQDIEELPEEFLAGHSVPETPAKPVQDVARPATNDAGVAIAPENADAPVPQEESVEKRHLCDVPMNETLSEGDFLIEGVKFIEKIGRNGKSVITCADTDGTVYEIGKWGKVSDPDKLIGSICTILLIKVGEYQGNRQYMADKIITKEGA